MLAYFAGLLTLPVIAAAGIFYSWAFVKTRGNGKCAVDGCRLKANEPGDTYDIKVWARGLWHDWITNRPGTAHRQAVLDDGRKWLARGAAIHPAIRRQIERQDRKAQA